MSQYIVSAMLSYSYFLSWLDHVRCGECHGATLGRLSTLIQIEQRQLQQVVPVVYWRRKRGKGLPGILAMPCPCVFGDTAKNHAFEIRRESTMRADFSHMRRQRRQRHRTKNVAYKGNFGSFLHLSYLIIIVVLIFKAGREVLSLFIINFYGTCFIPQS